MHMRDQIGHDFIQFKTPNKFRPSHSSYRFQRNNVHAKLYLKKSTADLYQSKYILFVQIVSRVLQ